MPSPLLDIAVVIPAWQPDDRLIDLAQSLAAHHFAAIVVVDDGSSESHECIFERVSRIPSVIVLRHAQNCGTGCATKTGLRYVMGNLPSLMGVVTADSDGQHAVQDIVRVAETLAGSQVRPVLGTRKFGAGVPLRSRFGNVITRYVFRFLSGITIADTQCGLRGIPKQWIPKVLRVDADRFEFVISLLALFCHAGMPPIEVPIATIYIDKNRSSHFNPVRDSVRIYLHLIHCYSSFVIPACIDLAGFVLMHAVSRKVSMAVLAGRLAAIAALALLHFTSQANRSTNRAFVRRIAFLAATGVVSFGAIGSLAYKWDWNILTAKIVVEFALYLTLDAIRVISRSRDRCTAEPVSVKHCAPQ